MVWCPRSGSAEAEVMRLLRTLFFLVALALAAYAGFRWGPAVFPRVEALLGLAGSGAEEGSGAPAPSPELAEATLDRFEHFRSGDGEGRLTLGGTELSSLVRYALPGLIPRGVTEPTVSLREGRVRISARVATEAFPRLPALEQVMGLLPDTVLLELEGALVPLDQAFMALLVDKVEASRIPIPKRLISDILAGIGLEGPGNLPADALAVPIPDGVAAVFVQKDSLVLQARR
jgi:hypothetical protein